MDPAAGLFDPQFATLLQKVSAELVRYTPEHFKRIHCTVRQRGANGPLAYSISCPEYPDEGTEKVNQGVQNAMEELVRYWTRDGAGFPGMKIILDIQPDGSIKNHFELLRNGESTMARPGADRPQRDLVGPAVRPAWVEIGLWGIKSRGLAWAFVWISVALAVFPSVIGIMRGDMRFTICGLFLLAALWYVLCIQWMDEHGGWSEQGG
jgi:hypothetical protein